MNVAQSGQGFQALVNYFEGRPPSDEDHRWGARTSRILRHILLPKMSAPQEQKRPRSHRRNGRKHVARTNGIAASKMANLRVCNRPEEQWVRTSTQCGLPCSHPRELSCPVLQPAQNLPLPLSAAPPTAGAEWPKSVPDTARVVKLEDTLCVAFSYVSGSPPSVHISSFFSSVSVSASDLFLCWLMISRGIASQSHCCYPVKCQHVFQKPAPSA